MKSFCFIICLTPARLRNKIREELFNTCLLALRSQSYGNWKAIIAGEETKTEGSLTYLRCKTEEKRSRILEVLEYINREKMSFDYLIRLDDDDIISPKALQRIAAMKEMHDCYYDSFHVYIDPVYTKISYKQNPWMANTVVHRFDHALKRSGEDGIPLLAKDHSKAWHHFYRSMNTLSSPKYDPIYYRVLSPFTVTAEQNTHAINWETHLNYLNGYGPWTDIPRDFSLTEQVRSMGKLFGTKPRRSGFYWWFNHLKYMIGS